ncbi:hypothetical protein PM082_009580 [Marasmius tenuissimus]|nr:hypothetical protein PM082_009580 [Marasmius tenuissimus]
MRPRSHSRKRPRTSGPGSGSGSGSDGVSAEEDRLPRAKQLTDFTSSKVRVVEFEKTLKELSDAQNTIKELQAQEKNMVELESELKATRESLATAQEQVVEAVTKPYTAITNDQFADALDLVVADFNNNYSGLERKFITKFAELEHQHEKQMKSLTETLNIANRGQTGSAEITKMKEEIKGLRAQIPTTEDRKRFAQLQEETDKRQSKISELEKVIDRLRNRGPAEGRDQERETKSREQARDLRKAQEQVRHLEDEKKNLASQLEEKTNEQGVSESRISQLNTQVTALEQEQEGRSQKIMSLETDKTELQKSLGRRDDEEVKLWEEIKNLRLAATQGGGNMRSLQAKVEHLERQNAGLQASIPSKEDREKLSHLQHAIEELQRENAELKSELPTDEDMEKATKELDDLRAKIPELEAKSKELREAQDRVKKLQSEKEEKLDEKEELDIAISTLNGRIDVLEQEQGERDDTIAALEEDKEELVDCLKGRDADLLKALAELKTLKNEVTVSSNKARTSESQHTASLATINKLRENLKTTRDLLRAAEGGLGDARRELQALKIENNGNSESVKQLQALLDTNAHEGQGRETSKDGEIADLNMEVTRLNTELTKAKDKVKDIEKTVLDLKASKDAEIANLTGQLRDKSGDTAAVALKEAEIKRKEAEITKLKEDLKEKDGAASREGDSNRREIAHLQEKLKEANETIANLRANPLNPSPIIPPPIIPPPIIPPPIIPPPPNPPPPNPSSSNPLPPGSASSSRTTGELFRDLMRALQPVTSSSGMNIEEERRLAEEKRPTLEFGGPIPPVPTPAKKKKKARARGNEEEGGYMGGSDDNAGGSDEEEEEEDAAAVPELDKTDPESNKSFWRSHYSLLNLGRTRPTNKEKANNLNNLILRVILEALPPDPERKDIDHVQDVWARDGVTTERLSQFNLDPDKFSPKVHNTRLDKNGSTTDELRRSKWNRVLIHNLEQLVLLIVKECPDKNHFAPLDSDGCTKKFKKHFDRVYAGVIASRPKNDEEAQDPFVLALRLIGERCERNAKSSVVARQRHKFDRRLKIIYHMRARTKDDTAQFPFWEYARRMTEHLTKNGMSDEETVTKERRTSGGLLERYTVMEVLNLPGRHPYFRPFFRAIEATPAFENISFHEDQRQRYPREYVDRDGKKPLSQTGLSRSMFADGYLDQLLEYERFALKLDDEVRPLHVFALHGFRWPEASANS